MIESSHFIFENPAKKNKIGLDIAPINRLFVCDSINNWIAERPQLKKINDSYKLLKGKYFSLIQRNNKVNPKRILQLKINVFPSLKRKLFLVAPLHHHFQAKGWQSQTVTMRYWIVSYICAMLGVVIVLIS